MMKSATAVKAKIKNKAGGTDTNGCYKAHRFYIKSVNYFWKKGMYQAAEVLKDIHEMRQKEN